MPEPLSSDFKKEEERVRLAAQFYKYYFLFGEVARDVNSIMSGKDAKDYDTISDDEKERRAVLRHGIGNWIMAPTIAVMSGRMERFVGPEEQIRLEKSAEDFLQYASKATITWAQKIEEGKKFIIACLKHLYPDKEAEDIRKDIGGETQENEWLEKLREEEHIAKSPTSQSPRT